MQVQHRHEFRYGTFTRHVALPVTADASDMRATYHWGILEVSIGLQDADEDKNGRRIPVQTTAPMMGSGTVGTRWCAIGSLGRAGRVNSSRAKACQRPE
jgi:Hsp20/alpha crystallin family protein